MNDEKMGCLEVIGLFLAVALVFALAWMASTSDLPEWFKFFLLK